MSDAIEAGAEALAPGVITAPMHEYSRRYDNHSLVTRVQHQKTVMGDVRSVLDAATSDVEAMARVLWDHDHADMTPEWREMAWGDMGGSEKDEERAAYELRAQAIRDWLLGGEG